MDLQDYLKALDHQKATDKLLGREHRVEAIDAEIARVTALGAIDEPIAEAIEDDIVEDDADVGAPPVLETVIPTPMEQAVPAKAKK